MNVIKKIIAVTVIAVIIIRAFTIEAFAFAGAPVIAAEEITALLETALVGSGLYTESELEGKSYFELNDLLKEGINSGQINPKANYYTDPISEIQYNLFELLTKPEVQAGIGIINGTVSSVVDNVIDDFLSDYEKLSDSVEFTSMVDLEGSGALGVYKGENDWYNYTRYVYGDYGIVNLYPNGQNVWERNSMSSNDSPSCYVIDYVYNKDGSLFRVDKYFVDDYRDHADFTQIGFLVTTITSVNYYGDWRTVDDTPIETDDTEIPVIGEVDGTQVTPDMLNPDGTVTIDGTTYYPKDFIDWDKFKDPAIIDLLNDILKELENIPVVSEQDNPIVGADDVTVDVPEKFQDYAVPTGIVTVFPFCIPRDIVRGFKILVRPVVIPKFDIPFNIPSFGLFEGVEYSITLDFEEYDKYVQIFRWFQVIGFSLLLCKLSLTRVKGAGA